MPIKLNDACLKYYYAVVNDDGTYGEPILLKEITIIKIKWEENNNEHN